MKVNSVLIPLPFPCLLMLLFAGPLFSQDTGSDSAFFTQALFNSKALYHQSFGNRSALYNGSKYAEFLFVFKEGQPFFKSPQPVNGCVRYDGILYDSVLMNYDEITDALIVHDQGFKIQLLKEKIDWFKLFNAEFIRLVRDSLTGRPESTGFYNVLYKGKVSLLKKQTKTIVESISGNVELERSIEEKNYYYLEKDGRIYSIKDSKDLLGLFGDRKKDVQQFIKAGKLSFRKDRQNMLTRATAYYDTLKN